MDLKILRLRLEAEHHNQPQDVRLIQIGISELESGLAKLAGLGHPFHLEAGHKLLETDWPRLMFHVEKAPNGRLVINEFEARELGAGWFFTSAEAHHWDGVQTQFAGRGGVHRGTSLLIVDNQPTLPRMLTNYEIIEAWRKDQAEKQTTESKNV